MNDSMYSPIAVPGSGTPVQIDVISVAQQGPLGPVGPVGPEGPKGDPGNYPEAPNDAYVYGRGGNPVVNWMRTLPLAGGSLTGTLSGTTAVFDTINAGTLNATALATFSNGLSVTGGSLGAPNGTSAAPGLAIGALDGTGLMRSGTAMVFGIQNAPNLAMFAGGTSQFYGPLAMLNNKITGLADATAAQDALNQRSGDARYLNIAGGTLSGPLTLSANAASALQPVTLQQMNAATGAYLPLSGGTLSGALTTPTLTNTGTLTVSGTGNALVVNNSAYVQGTVLVGTGAQNRITLTPGANSTTASSITTQNTAGLIQGPGPFQSTNNWLGRGSTFTYSGATSFSTSNMAIFAQSSLTGTVAPTTAQSFPTVASFQSPSGNITGNVNTIVFATGVLQNTGGAAAVANQWEALDVALADTAPTNDKASGTQGAWVAAQITRTASQNQGGTGVAPGTAFGANWGMDVICAATPAATNLALMNGIEINMSVQTGASVMRRAGLQISNPPNHTTRGAMWDNEILILRAVGSAPFRNGLSFGGLLSPTTVGGNDSKVIAYEFAQDHTANARIGVDFNDVTFTTAALRTPGFLVDSSGNINTGTAQLTATGTGLNFDVNGVVGTGTPTISAAGSGYGNPTIADDAYGGSYLLTAPSGAVTTVLVLRQPIYFGSTPPATLALTSRAPSTGTGCVLNASWTSARTALALNPSGGQVTAPTPATNDNSTNVATTAFVAAATGAYLPLAGGTVTGALSLSGAATALTVNNTAAFGATTPMTIAKGAITNAAGQNFVLSMGGSGSTYTLAGTGGTGTPMQVTAGAQNIIDFGVSVTNLVKTKWMLLNPGIAVLSGVFSANTSPLSMTFSPSGTVTPTSGQYPYLQWTVNSDTVNVGTGNVVNFLNIAMNAGGAAMTGNRGGVNIAMTQTAASGNASGNTVYQGGQASGNCSFPEGGTGLTTATAKGANYAWNEYARLFSGATNFYVNKAKEIDLQVAAGASTLKNIGVDAVLLSTHANQGAYADYAYGINRQPGSTVGFKTGIQFGVFDGVDPFGANSTAISWVVGNSPTTISPQLLNGIDFRIGAISNNAFAATNTVIKGNGTAYLAGNAQIAQTGSGASIDVALKTGSYVSIATGGAGHQAGDYYMDNADIPAVWSVTSVVGGAANAAALLNGSKPYSATGPATLTLTGVNPDRPATCTVNMVWATNNQLSLNPSGGVVTAPTPATADSSTAVATTAFVKAQNYGVVNKLYTSGTVVGNGADTTEDTLYTFTLAAGQLAVVGDIIRIKVGGGLAATTDNKTLRVKLGGQIVGSLAATGAAQTAWYCEASIIKTGTNTQSYISSFILTAGNANPRSGTLTLTDTGTLVVAVTGQNNTTAAANSITAQAITVEYQH